MLIHVVVLASFAACQASPLGYNPKIVGGKDTLIEKHPYQGVEVYINYPRHLFEVVYAPSTTFYFNYVQVSLQVNGRHDCGGAIITTKNIVTAAHCLLGDQSASRTVRVGSTDRETGGTVYEAIGIWPHPLFATQGFRYDVGIIVLNAPITYSLTAQPVKLVGENQEPHHGEMLTVTGWGLTKDGGGDSRAEKLQILRVPLINSDFCRKSYKLPFTDNMICAGGGGNDKGVMPTDSGGPLINEKGELVGILSIKHVVYRKGYPGVYTNVASHDIRKFILDNIV